MKKAAFILVAVMAFAGSVLSFPASAATEKTFSDDFSNGLSKWSHANNDDVEMNDDKALDASKSYKVENGQLHIDAVYDANSFLFLTPEGVKAAEFKISWKMKSNITNDSWVGVSVLKDTKDRFNGSNNALCYFRFSDSGVAFQLGRGYPGGGGIVDQTPKLVGPGMLKLDVKKFHTYQVEYKAGVFKASVDGELVGTIEYAKLKNPGFISLNACVADVLVDDFKIVYSETASPVSNTTSTGSKSSTTTSSTAKTNDSKTTVNDSTDSTDTQSTDDTTANTEVTGEDTTAITDNNTTANQDVTTTKADDTLGNDDGGSGTGWIIAGVVILVLAGAFAIVYFAILKPKGGFAAIFKK